MYREAILAYNIFLPLCVKILTMPIYEYQCQTCGYKEDIIQKFSDPPETHCPNCGKDTLHKNVTAPSFQLSGSGWYATDYKDKPAVKSDADKSASTDNKTAAAPEGQSAKTDTKNESATQTSAPPTEKPKTDA